MALPHRLDADDEYKGYHLPENSVVLANTWLVYPLPFVSYPCLIYRFVSIQGNIAR